MGTQTRVVYVNIPKIGCVYFYSDKKSAGWSCDKGTLTGDSCTCPNAL
jgi:hypothetical protein